MRAISPLPVCMQLTVAASLRHLHNICPHQLPSVHRYQLWEAMSNPLWSKQETKEQKHMSLYEYTEQ